jgi:nucleoside-diphosphate-sugar epimerase
VRLVDVWTLTDAGLGANRGVGNQLTRRLLARGHEVWGTYRPDTKSAKDDESVKEVSFFWSFLAVLMRRLGR